MIQAPVPLGQVHLFAARIAIGIGPDLVVKPDRVDYECVAVPLANRVSEPAGVGVFWEGSPVGPDRAPDVVLLKEHQHPAGNLDDLEWIGKSEKPRRACWVTAQNWIVFLSRNGPRSY